MILNHGKLVEGFVDELLKVIHKYDDSIFTSTVIGALEIIKQQLINDLMEKE